VSSGDGIGSAKREYGSNVDGTHGRAVGSRVADKRLLNPAIEVSIPTAPQPIKARN